MLADLTTMTSPCDDAREFEQCLHRASCCNDSGEKELLLEQAILLYSEDFQAEEELENRRLLTKRESLQRSRSNVALELADLRASRNVPVPAI